MKKTSPIFWQLGISAALLSLALSAACPQAPADDPVSAYQGFYQAAADSDLEKMLDLLEPETLRCLNRQAEQMARQAGVKEEPLSFYLSQLRAERVTPLREIKLLEENADRALLEVKAGPCDKQENCTLRRVELRRGPSGWRVRPERNAPLGESFGKPEC